MINLKTVAATIAAVVVAGAAVKEYTIRALAKDVTSVEESIAAFYSPEFIAFTKAQDVLSDRMLNGFYDNVSDDMVRADYDVIYANFLSK